MAIRSTGRTSSGEFTEGSRCLAGPGGHWSPATILRINEDGTVQIEFDVKQMQILPVWYGVTRSELSLDDEGMWPDVFRKICSPAGDFTLPNLVTALEERESGVDTEAVRQFWIAACAQEFEMPPAMSEPAHLDREQAYHLIRAAGACAREIDNWYGDSAAYCKLYWNQIRIGGRDPQELSRPVRIDDAIEALGLAEAGVDSDAAGRLEALEREYNVRLPADLTRILSLPRIAAMLHDCHPNTPDALLPGHPAFRLQRIDSDELGAEFAMTLMTVGGGPSWWAVFNDGDEDARVYAHMQPNPQVDLFKFAAPTLSLFLWDLAQTGLTWSQHTQKGGGKPVRKTEIGLAPA
jgi:hypothetical protein